MHVGCSLRTAFHYIFSMTVDERRLENAKNSNIQGGTGWSKSMPAEFDADGLLKKGDVVHIPNEYIWFDPANPNNNWNCGVMRFGNNASEFVICKITHADGTESSFNFFPTSLYKNIFVSEMVNGVVKLKLPVLHPTGSMVDYYLSFRGKAEKDADGNIIKTDVGVAMDAMKGTSFEVTGDEIVKTQKWVNGNAQNELKDTHKFEYTKK